MTAAIRARHDGTGSFPAASARITEDLELPRPLRLALTAGWNLSESVGLPVAAYVVAAWPGGRNAGLAAALAAIWLTVVIRKVATGSVPSLLTISALVLTVQTAVVLATGELWLFLLQFPLANLCLCVLFARTASGPDPLVACGARIHDQGGDLRPWVTAWSFQAAISYSDVRPPRTCLRRIWCSARLIFGGRL